MQLSAKLQQGKALARELMDHWGLQSWEFGFNRLRRKTGLCYWPAGGGPGRIELSVHFVELNPPEKVRDTLLHEIAHALAGPDAGHGPLWKQWCVRVGAEPERLCTDAVLPKGKWLGHCSGCGFEHTRFRKPLDRAYRCTFCGGEVAFRKQSFFGSETGAGSPGLRPEAASALTLFRPGGMG